MTLSNIFFGKKVVLQAYYKNALIYQSQGWQNLPTNCLQVWDKGTGFGDQCDSYLAKVDNKNNLIVSGNKSGNSKLLKISSDGDVIWSVNIPTSSNGLIVGENDKIYCLTSQGINGSFVSYLKIYDTNNGTEIKTIDITKAIGSPSLAGVGLAADSQFIYCLLQLKLVVFNYNGELVKPAFQLDNYANCIAADLKKYIYIGYAEGTVRYDKSNLNNQLKVDRNPMPPATQIACDGLGNMYELANSSYLDKVWSESGKILYTYSIDANSYDRIFSSCTDYKNNVYYLKYVNYTGKNMLMGYNPDTSVKWSGIEVNSSTWNNVIVADSLGNIYVVYSGKDDQKLRIKKLINVVKGN